jgi:hypothetical protein
MPKPQTARVARVLLVLYAVGSIAVAVPLLVYGHAGDLAETTSGRVLAAALIALAVGALGAARDPWAHRLVIKILIVFTSLAALAIAYRLAAGNHQNDPAWALLPIAVAAPVLFAVFYPRPPAP